MLVEGPAGIGKTALIRRFLEEARPPIVVGAAGDEAETHLPYGMLAQLLAGIPDATAVVGQLTGDREHLSVGARMLRVLDNIQAQGPVVLVIEDAHWVDAPSLQALTFALRRLHADQVLAVFAAWDEPARLTEGVRRLAEGERGLRIRLAGLPADELAELAAGLGVGPLPRRARERLFEHTGGSPIHARALFEELDPHTSWWAEEPLPAPRSFASMVLARLAGCSPSTKRLVEGSAVLGLRCSLGLALRLADVDDAAGPLEEAAVPRLLEVTDGTRTVAFPHPLVRAAVYHGMGPSQRSALHNRAAAALEGGAALDHRVAAVLGEDAALAVEVAAYAREEAARGGSAAAAAHLVAAAWLHPEGGSREDLLLDAFELLLFSGEVADAVLLVPDVQRCVDSARRLTLLGHLAVLTGHQDEAEVLLRAAWDRCDPAAEAVLAMLTSAQLAQMCLLDLRVEEAIEWARRSMAAAGPARATPALAVLVIGLGMVGRSDEALALAGRQPGPDSDSPAGLLLRFGQGIVKMWNDDLPGARRDLAAVVAASHDHPSSREGVMGLSFLAEVEYRLGAWNDSVLHAGLAVSLATDADQHWALALVHSSAAWVPAARGEFDVADHHVRTAAGHATRLGDAGVLAAATAGAHYALCRGDAAGAAEALAPAVEMGARAQRVEPGVNVWRELWAEAMVALGRLEEAEAALEPLETLAAARGRRACQGRAARVRGTLNAARGNRPAAQAAFEASLVFLEGLRMPFELALADDAYGRFLRRTGKRRRAAGHLQAALDTYHRLGSRPFSTRCARELAACGLPGTRRDQSKQTDLTPQEQAVARLVAAGRTNREVAAELVVSVKTVEYHLGNIFAKLRITSRSQLVWALTKD